MYAKLPSKAKPSGSLSKDKTRPLLASANLVEKDGEWSLVSCDSYQLAVLPLDVRDVDVEPALTPGPIPADALKAIEKAGAFQANGVVAPVDTFGRPTGMTFARPEPAGRYPDHERLFPDVVDRFRVALNAKLLLDLARSLGSTRDEVVLSIEPKGLKAIVVEPRAGNGARGVLMPVRIKA